MAPPSVEINGESTSSEAHRCLPTPFLTKTYQLVDDLSIDDIISWNEDGSAFIVWRPVEFARDLLPKYFKHNNFSSFVRQLNTYGFRKIVPDRWEFANDCFKRGEKKLLSEIHRRKISSAVISTATAVIPAPQVGSPTNSSDEQVISSNSPPMPAPCRTSSSTADLADENDRLRKENLQLSQELTQMKNLCNNIFVLMTKYAGGCNGYAETSFPAEKELDLLPVARRFLEEPDNPAESGVQGRGAVMAEEETRPKLFGVPIGVKRVRGEDDLQQPVGPAEEVKSEPLDSRSDLQDPHWLTRCSRQKSKCL